jgi:aspartate/methionine/tyrosine aminotransferase
VTRRVSERIAEISPSATLAVDAKATELKAAGRPIVGFGAGQPDFPTPGYIVEAAKAACDERSNHGYTPASGQPALREALAEKTVRDSGYHVEPSQIVVTNGGKQAVYNAFAALCDPGDEVLLPAPYWTTYPESIRLAGGVPVPVTADESSAYLVSVEQLEATRTERTKALLYNSPANPTGAVYPRELVTEIGRWAYEHGIWVVTDEIYEHLVYDGASAPSMPVAVPELAEQTLVLNGVAKTYAMTGWRVGWVIAPPDMAKAIGNLQSHLCGNVSNVAQQAALAAVAGPLDAVHEMGIAFDRRRRTIVERLSALPGVTCPTPRGAFYAYPSVKDLLGREIRGKRPSTTVELAALMLEEAEVAVVPGEAFGTPGYFRLSYALGDENLTEGVRRMAEFFGEAKY